MQAPPVNSVPYLPQLVGLNDCNFCIKFAVNSYNSAKHSTVALTPNELAMGPCLRSPNEILRRPVLLPVYHAKLLRAMERSERFAERARRMEQARPSTTTGTPNNGEYLESESRPN
ncbi:hypothetical protein L914_21274 [Phytophthora nicotianae]|uniref:Uncharacterized protein n=2 Tax=Phytophthora nicotianae TaxID=4792 RepID=W2M675_PHYNI|nr:hypothetical protein L914_21274 [Phytophthora nicotianae]